MPPATPCWWRRIETSVRPVDIAARMGGDEFAVLLQDVDDQHGEQVASRMLDLLADPVTVDGEAFYVRSSVGIATAAAGSLEADELLRQADVAMYRAKDAGKSQVRVWFPEMQPAAESGPSGREELAAALEHGEVVAHFQPVVSLETGAVVPRRSCATPTRSWSPRSIARCWRRRARRRSPVRCRWCT